MAHYALINKDTNIVEQVITGVDENIIQTDLDGTQVGGSSEAWEQFYASCPWFENVYCKRTSYNGNIRANFAGIGMKYDQDLDAFIHPQPYPSWVLNLNNYQWESPVPYPQIDNGSDETYVWDENTTSWLLLPPSN